MATGGTLAPGVRQSAAAIALGAPRVAGVKAQRPTSAKMPKATKAPAKLPRPAAKAPAPHAPAKPAARPQIFNPLEGVQSGKELQGLARAGAHEIANSELTPLRQQSTQIGQNELGASERYGKYSEAANNLLGSVASQQQASAKTFENQAADSALQAGKVIDTAGQNQASLTDGYVSPELRAQLNAEASQSSAAGAAGNTFAQSSAQSGENLLAGIRGAAALRSVEGQQKITGNFQKQQQANQSQQATAIGRIGANTSKLQTELGQKQFTDAITQQSLGIKQGQLGVARQNAVSKARGVGVSEQKLGLEGQKFAFGKWAKENEIAISKLSATDKAQYDQAQTRYKAYLEGHGGKEPSPAEGRKYIAKLSSAVEIAHQVLAGVNNGRGNAELQKKAREELVKQGASADVVSAALNLAVYGRLGPADQAAAISYGLTPNLRPQWFTKGK